MGRKNRITVTGDGGTVISGTTGSVALNGDVHDGDTSRNSKNAGRRTVSGKGMTVIKGDNNDTISRCF